MGDCDVLFRLQMMEIIRKKSTSSSYHSQEFWKSISQKYYEYLKDLVGKSFVLGCARHDIIDQPTNEGVVDICIITL